MATNRHIIILSALSLLISATYAKVPDDQCGAKSPQNYVKQPLSELNIIRLSGDARIFTQATSITSDYKANRLNILLDSNDNKIEDHINILDIYCG